METKNIVKKELKQADILFLDNYIREAKRQLNEPRNYKVLAKDPTTTNNDLINQTIDRFTK